MLTIVDISHRRVFARLAALAFLAALAGAFTAPGARAAPAAGARAELTIGITQFPATLHPSIDTMLAKSFVLYMTRRPFTVYDPDWELVCMLCERLPTIENGRAWIEDLPEDGDFEHERGIAVTYTIREGARWGDGTPVTAEDVVFTWKVGRDPVAGVTNAELYRRIREVEVKDSRTFVLHFDRVGFDYNAINDFNLLPAHLERAPFAEPAEYKNRTLYDTDSTNPGLYYGPYRIAEVQRGAHIVLEPNPTWWGRKPHFRRIVVRVVENTAALEANLLSGGIDYIAGELGLSLDQALSFEKRHRGKFKVVYKPSLVYEHIDLNLDSPLLADRRVRQALLYAIDREAISERLFEGRQPVADTNVSPLDWVHAEDVKEYPYDPAKAAALLDEAGWRLAPGEEVRRNADGKPLRLTLMTTAGNRSREMVQVVLQSHWRRVGVDVRIRNEPARVFFGRTVSRREFPHMAMFAWLSAPESVPRSTLHSEEIPSADNGWSGQNFTGYRNPEMDALIDRLEVTLEREKRRGMWRRLQRIYAEDLPALPLYFRANAFIMPGWLTGIRPTGHQYPSTLWVEEWGVAVGARAAADGEAR